jgi:hypothetical protein
MSTGISAPGCHGWGLGFSFSRRWLSSGGRGAQEPQISVRVLQGFTRQAQRHDIVVRILEQVPEGLFGGRPPGEALLDGRPELAHAPRRLLTEGLGGFGDQDGQVGLDERDSYRKACWNYSPVTPCGQAKRGRLQTDLGPKQQATEQRGQAGWVAEWAQRQLQDPAHLVREESCSPSPITKPTLDNCPALLLL